jgi:hypothetical protein
MAIKRPNMHTAGEKLMSEMLISESILIHTDRDIATREVLHHLNREKVNDMLGYLGRVIDDPQFQLDLEDYEFINTCLLKLSDKTEAARARYKSRAGIADSDTIHSTALNTTYELSKTGVVLSNEEYLTYLNILRGELVRLKEGQ